MPITAVILDIDDTLFMTEAVAFEMENAAARRMGVPPMSRNIHLATWGLAVQDALPRRFPGIDQPRFVDLHAQIISEYVALGKLDALTEANIAALTTLMKSNYQLFALTSRQEGEIKHFLEGAHALQAFLSAESMYHRGRTKYRKPDPRVFDELLQESGLKPAECLYVGDSEHDCRAAKGAGLQFVACLESGLRERAVFEALTPPPDGYIDTFAELPAWLSRRQSLSRK